MNALQTFDYHDKTVRTVIKDGEPWFVAKDVCDVLELSNPTVALRKLDEDERSKFNLGRQGETNIVNEYGLYSLILTSRKPEAKQFKRWITHEVIPAIRKTGHYSIEPNEAVKDYLNLSEEDRAIVYFQELKERKKLQSQLEEQKPKVEAYELFMNGENSQSLSDVAKALGYGPQKFCAFLRNEKVLFKRNGVNVPYQQYIDQGYFEVIEIPVGERNVLQTKVTAKGADFISRLIKRRGVSTAKIIRLRGLTS